MSTPGHWWRCSWALLEGSFLACVILYIHHSVISLVGFASKQICSLGPGHRLFDQGINSSNRYLNWQHCNRFSLYISSRHSTAATARCHWQPLSPGSWPWIRSNSPWTLFGRSFPAFHTRSCCQLMRAPLYRALRLCFENSWGFPVASRLISQDCWMRLIDLNGCSCTLPTIVGWHRGGMFLWMTVRLWLLRYNCGQMNTTDVPNA